MTGLLLLVGLSVAQAAGSGSGGDDACASSKRQRPLLPSQSPKRSPFGLHKPPLKEEPISVSRSSRFLTLVLTAVALALVACQRDAHTPTSVLPPRMTVTSDTTYHPGHCPDGTGTCFNETDPEHQLLENVGNRLNWSDPTCSAMYNNLFSQLEWGGIDEWTVDNGMGGYWISGFHGYDSNGKRYDAISLPYFAVNAQYIGSWNTAHALFHEAAHSYWNNDNDEIAEDWANQCIFKP